VTYPQSPPQQPVPPFKVSRPPWSPDGKTRRREGWVVHPPKTRKNHLAGQRVKMRIARSVGISSCPSFFFFVPLISSPPFHFLRSFVNAVNCIPLTLLDPQIPSNVWRPNLDFGAGPCSFGPLYWSSVTNGTFPRNQVLAMYWPPVPRDQCTGNVSVYTRYTLLPYINTGIHSYLGIHSY
jgi:hypothetical protein